ncbi:MAG: DUF6427 family protein [Bacteroidales bacterium]|nr:DUF6427 family protein [Bacteroidales bacterium]
MFHFIYKKNFLQLVLLLFAVVATIGQLTFLPTLFLTPAAQGLYYSGLYETFFSHPIAFRITYGLILAIEALLIHFIINKHNFLDKESYLPSFWFLALTLSIAPHATFAPTIFTNFATLLLLAISLEFFDKENNTIPLLSGLLVSAASLIDPAAIFLLLFVCTSLFIGRTRIPKGLCLLSIGFFLPYIYLFSFYYITDRIPMLTDYFVSNQFFKLVVSEHQQRAVLFFLIITFFLSTIYIIPTLKFHYDNRIILLRKKFMIVTMLFVALLFVLLFGHSSLRFSIAYLIIPFTLYLSMLNQIKVRRIVHDIIILVFFTSILLIQNWL